MSTILNPYLAFPGTAAEAMTFYQSVLGGDLTTSRFGELGMGGPTEADKIMHAQLSTPGGLTLMASDVPDGVDLRPGSTISISLSGEDEAELRGYFEGLSAGGTVNQPFVRAPWGDTFGMLTDRFGVDWLVNALGPQGQVED
jgi:PhnB protein